MNINSEITTAAIATIVSASTAAIVSLIVTHLNKKYNERKTLNDRLENILKIAIQYPYLEDDKFVKAWSSDKSNDEQYQRYDIYCSLLFNYMEELCEFHNYKESEISKHINLKDWIRTHKKNWLEPSGEFENIDSYPTKFKNLINGYLK